jgi:hypothetical protein
MTPLILKRAALSRPSGEWRDDDYDVLENGGVVGRIFTVLSAALEGRPWMWQEGTTCPSLGKVASANAGCGRSGN